MTREEDARAAFAEQAAFCRELDALFTAQLCALLGERLDRGTPLGRRILDWLGDPAPFGDALALRLCGGLHFFVRTGAAPALAALYPPAPAPHDEALWAALAPLLDDPGLDAWLDRAPQTNEVGRAAILFAGLLVAAEHTRLPIRLHELGASAGLNLQLDHYGYDLGGLEAGDPAAALRLRPEWRGPPPPASHVRIIARAGVDLSPARLPQDRERLIAYIWPEQPERIARIEAALDAGEPPPIERGDAADWVEARLARQAETGVARVVMHSVAFHYFPKQAQARIRAHLEAVGATSNERAPLAWLRYEKDPGEPRFSLRLRTWPGEDALLAWTNPHGGTVEWVAPA